MKKAKPLTLTTDEACHRLALSPSQLRRITALWSIFPEREARGSGRRRYEVHLWPSSMIGPIKRTNEYKKMIAKNGRRRDPEAIEAARVRREAKQALLEAREFAELEESNRRKPIKLATIGRLVASIPDGDDLLLSGVIAAVELNRAARGGDGNTFYQRKNVLVQWLYEHGYCRSVELHHQHKPAKMCHSCDGDGYRWNGAECYKCDGTGIYLASLTIDLFCFYFEVLGYEFSFHQPEEYVGDWLADRPTTPTASLPQMPYRSIGSEGYRMVFDRFMSEVVVIHANGSQN